MPIVTKTISARPVTGGLKPIRKKGLLMRLLTGLASRVGEWGRANLPRMKQGLISLPGKCFAAVQMSAKNTGVRVTAFWEWIKKTYYAVLDWDYGDFTHRLVFGLLLVLSGDLALWLWPYVQYGIPISSAALGHACIFKIAPVILLALFSIYGRPLWLTLTAMWATLLLMIHIRNFSAYSLAMPWDWWPRFFSLWAAVGAFGVAFFAFSQRWHLRQKEWLHDFGERRTPKEFFSETFQALKQLGLSDVTTFKNTWQAQRNKMTQRMTEYRAQSKKSIKQYKMQAMAQWRQAPRQLATQWKAIKANSLRQVKTIQTQTKNKLKQVPRQVASRWKAMRSNGTRRFTAVQAQVKNKIRQAPRQMASHWKTLRSGSARKIKMIQAQSKSKMQQIPRQTAAQWKSLRSNSARSAKVMQTQIRNVQNQTKNKMRQVPKQVSKLSSDGVRGVKGSWAQSKKWVKLGNRQVSVLWRAFRIGAKKQIKIWQGEAKNKWAEILKRYSF